MKPKKLLSSNIHILTEKEYIDYLLTRGLTKEEAILACSNAMRRRERSEVKE